MRIIDFKWIPLEQLTVSNANIRKTLLEREKEVLKKTIKRKGILDVLTVFYNEDLQKYEIIKGQRRFLAAKELRDEGVNITKLPCVIKEGSEVEAVEESLLDELTRVIIEKKDTGNAILKLVQHYGDLGKVSQMLGVPEDWLSFYIRELSLNPPAKVFEPVKEERKIAKESGLTYTPIDTFTQSKKNVSKDSLSDLSLEEQREARRRLQENPNIPTTLLKSVVKDWLENSFEVVGRLDKKIYKALQEYAKDHSITFRRLFDKKINEFFREWLKKEKYL